MVQSQVPRFALGLMALAASSFAAAQEPVKLENPWNLRREERRLGNYLAWYADLLRLEKNYAASPHRRTYYDALATAQSHLGDTVGAIRSWSEIEFTRAAKGPLTQHPFAGHTAIDAVRQIVAAGDRWNWIMIGEEHAKPQTRSILKPVLQGLWKKGFRYFAAETFTMEVQRSVSRGYPLVDMGYYTAEPVFAEAVRVAMKLGYKLVPYESEVEPKDVPPNDPMFRQNFRERTQAENLKARIVDKDSKAKVLVWAGRAHVYEELGKTPDGDITMMGHHFKKLTGVDPYSVYLPSGAEEYRPEQEFFEYRWADHLGLRSPTAYVKGLKNYDPDYDLSVFFPRTRLVKGRPDWLARDLGRIPVAVPTQLVAKEGLQLAQAFYQGEVQDACAMDQVLIKPGFPVPALMLPRGGRFLIRVVDPAGTAVGSATVKT